MFMMRILSSFIETIGIWYDWPIAIDDNQGEKECNIPKYRGPSPQTLEQWTRPATASRLSAGAVVSNLTRTSLNQAKPDMGISGL